MLQTKRVIALFAMCLCTLLWSTAGIIKHQLTHTPPAEITFWRSFFVGVSMLPVFMILYFRGDKQMTQLSRWTMFSGLMWACMFTCFMLAITLAPVSNALLVSSLGPVLTALLSWLVFKEMPTVKIMTSIILASIGLVWMFYHQMSVLTEQALWGMLIAFGVPLSASINTLVLNRHHTQANLFPSICLGGFISALMMLPFVLPFQTTFHDLGWLSILGVFQLVIPCSLMIWSLTYLKPTEVSLLAILETLFGITWVWLLFDDPPSPTTLQGGCFVMLGLCLMMIKFKFKRIKSQPVVN